VRSEASAVGADVGRADLTLRRLAAHLMRRDHAQRAALGASHVDAHVIVEARAGERDQYRGAAGDRPIIRLDQQRTVGVRVLDLRERVADLHAHARIADAAGRTVTSSELRSCSSVSRGCTMLPSKNTSAVLVKPLPRTTT